MLLFSSRPELYLPSRNRGEDVIDFLEMQKIHEAYEQASWQQLSPQS